MKINVVNNSAPEQKVNVTVDDGCNHYDVEEQEVNFGQGDQDDYRTTLVCSCGMLQDFDGCWVDV